MSPSVARVVREAARPARRLVDPSFEIVEDAPRKVCREVTLSWIQRFCSIPPRKTKFASRIHYTLKVFRMICLNLRDCGREHIVRDVRARKSGESRTEQRGSLQGFLV